MTEQHVIEYGITDAALAELKERYKDVDAGTDYEGAKVALKECTSLRTALEGKRKDLKKDALEYGRKVDSEAKRILGKIQEVEGPIKDSKQVVDDAAARIEAQRVAVINDKLAALDVTPAYDTSSEGLQVQIDALEDVVIDESFEEEFHHAKGLKADSLAKLRGAFAQAVQAENDRRDLAELKEKQKAEADKLAAERAEVEEAGRAQREEQERIDRQKDELAAEQRRIDEEKAAAHTRELVEKQAAADLLALKENEEREAKEEAERIERCKPDAHKLRDFANNIENMKVPKVATLEAETIVAATRVALKDCADVVRRFVGELQ